LQEDAMIACKTKNSMTFKSLIQMGLIKTFYVDKTIIYEKKLKILFQTFVGFLAVGFGELLLGFGVAKLLF